MSTDTPAELSDSELSPAEMCRRATHQMVSRAASDMAGLSDALLDRIGGVSGWATRYMELMDLCRQHGNKRVEADLLKMIPDTMERAQKAGKRVLEELSDDELEQAAELAMQRAIRQNPGLAVALATDAGFIDVQGLVPDAESGDD